MFGKRKQAKPVEPDPRFHNALYSLGEAKKFVNWGEHDTSIWFKVSEDAPALITAEEPATETSRSLPFIALAEMYVISSFLKTGLAIADVHEALVSTVAGMSSYSYLAESDFMFTAPGYVDNHARKGNERLSKLTTRTDGDLCFVEPVYSHLYRISYDLDDYFGNFDRGKERKYGQYALGFWLPIGERTLLQIWFGFCDNQPMFVNGGAPLSAVCSRLEAGEDLATVANDYDAPLEDIRDAMLAVYGP